MQTVGSVHVQLEKLAAVVLDLIQLVASILNIVILFLELFPAFGFEGEIQADSYEQPIFRFFVRTSVGLSVMRFF